MNHAVSTGSSADEKLIWQFFAGKGLNQFAIAGIMGNLYAESALRSNNLQGSYEKKLGYTDATYTEAVDNGSYSNFVRDAAGYGLAQWTYWSRKQALLNYAQSNKKSIADFHMQLEFLWKELQNYSAVMSVLKTAKSVQEASDIFMTKFESPADQSDAAKNKRAGFGQVYYNRYASTSTTAGSTNTSSDKVALPKLREVVEFTGTKHYVSSNSANGKVCKPGKARVTALAGAGKHPVHLVALPGGGSTVYGWVDTAFIAQESKSLAVGARVKVNAGAKTYTGGGLASFVYKNTYDVIRIEGDRVVIGVGEAVTAAINKKDLTVV